MRARMGITLSILLTLVPFIVGQNPSNKTYYASKPCSDTRDSQDCDYKNTWLECDRATATAPPGCTCKRFTPVGAQTYAHPYFNNEKLICVIPKGEACDFTKERKIECEPGTQCVRYVENDQPKDYGHCSGSIIISSLVLLFLPVATLFKA